MCFHIAPSLHAFMEALESGCLGLAFVTKGEGECGVRKVQPNIVSIGGFCGHNLKKIILLSRV